MGEIYTIKLKWKRKDLFIHVLVGINITMYEKYCMFY